MTEIVAAILAGLDELQRGGAIPSDFAVSQAGEDTLLASIGLDSLSRMTLLGQLEDRFDTLVPESHVAGVRTIGDLARVTLDSCRRSA